MTSTIPESNKGVTSTASCGVCGSAPLVPVLQAARVGGGTATLARCSVCHLVQTTPLPSNAELADYYRIYAYAAASAWETPPAVAHSLTALLTALEPYRTTGRLLDIGCGTGQILRVARDLGWKAHGTELSEHAVQRLKFEGFAVACLDDDRELPPGSFDVITLVEVLEHLRDPRAIVRRASTLLRPGGVFYLTTPNFNSLSRRCLGATWRIIEVPEHLFYFTPVSVRQLLAGVGFQEIWLRTEGLDPTAIVRGMLDGPAKPSANSGRDSTVVLRDASHKHRLLGLVKRGVNAVLRAGRIGDTLKVLSQKPTR
jgi:SAM-dependent methyltransferase